MAKYMLLLRDDGKYRELNPEEVQSVIARYSAWRDSLQKSGKLVSSDKLRDREGRVLRRDQSKIVVMDGPYTETKEILGGYFAVEAANYDEAIELARDCPHFDFGSMEIREIENMRP